MANSKILLHSLIYNRWKAATSRLKVFVFVYILDLCCMFHNFLLDVKFPKSFYYLWTNIVPLGGNQLKYYLFTAPTACVFVLTDQCYRFAKYWRNHGLLKKQMAAAASYNK